MIGLLQRFQARDIVSWFESRGVKLKTERDGRMFPTTDSSQTIIDCLLGAARAAGVKLHLNRGLETATQRPDGTFDLRLNAPDLHLWKGTGRGTKASPPVPAVPNNPKGSETASSPAFGTLSPFEGERERERGPLMCSPRGLVSETPSPSDGPRSPAIAFSSRRAAAAHQLWAR